MQQNNPKMRMNAPRLTSFIQQPLELILRLGEILFWWLLDQRQSFHVDSTTLKFNKYRVSSKTVCTCSLFVNCASHAGPIIKWSIYFFSWIKIDAENGITLKNWFKDSWEILIQRLQSFFGTNIWKQKCWFLCKLP